MDLAIFARTGIKRQIKSDHKGWRERLGASRNRFRTVRGNPRAAACAAVERLEDRVVLSVTAPWASTAMTHSVLALTHSASLTGHHLDLPLNKYAHDQVLPLGYVPQLAGTSHAFVQVPAGDAISGTTQTHLTIVPTFDSSITNDGNATTIEADINAAIQVYENYFSDPITVNIYFKEMSSGLGQSSTFRGSISYAAYLAAVKSHATTTNDTTAIASLPSTTNNPVNGNSSIYVSTANLRALGYNVNPSGGYDSTISLNTSITNLTRTSIDPNKYDLVAVASHEIDEALGIGSALNGLSNNVASPAGIIYGEDLYRYASPGARSFDTRLTASAYFSIDGGNTNLAQYNQVAGGDFTDWYSYYGVITPQVQDAFNTPGSTPNLNVELTALDVLGYTPITSAPTIITQPVSQTANASDTVTLYATANGSPTPIVQWQVSTDGGTTYTNVAGATSSSYTFAAAASQNGNLFRAVFTNSQGTATTTAATLTVNAAVSLDLRPYQVSGFSAPLVLSATAGNYTGATTFTTSQAVYLSFGVANYGPASTAAPVFVEVLMDGGIVEGFTFPAPFAGSSYSYYTDIPFGTLAAGSHTFQLVVNYNNRVAESNTANNTYTANVTVTGPSAPVTILTTPQSQSVPSGTTVGFTALATGNSVPTVQWQVSNTGGSSFTNIPGATSTTYSVTTSAALSGNLYRAVFTNSQGTVNSSAATLTVTAALPDLVPYQPAGWSAPLVLSTTSGSFTNAASIGSNQTIYVDTALTNAGPGTALAGVKNEILVDGNVVLQWTTSSALATGSYAHNDNASIGTLSAGLHTFALVSNYDNSTSESNTLNDTYLVNFTVTGPVVAAPTLTSSQIGNGTAQRSTLDGVTLVFNEAVNFTASSFTLSYETVADNQAVQNSGGSLTPTYTALSNANDLNFSSTDGGITWILSPKVGGAVDRTLGAGDSNGLGIFIDGLYSLNLHGSAITDLATGTSHFNSSLDQVVQFADGTGTLHSQFSALFGDIAGTANVTANDNKAFSKAFLTSSGDVGYNSAFDYTGTNSSINANDNKKFSKNFLVALVLS